jgi:serine/threonine protein phosphatase PrpC
MSFCLKIHTAPDIRENGVAVISNPRQTIILLCDGTASWGNGVSAASEALDQFKALWSGRGILSCEDIARDFEEVGVAMETAYSDHENDLYSEFSALAMVIGKEEVIIIHAGLYDAALIRGGRIKEKTLSQTVAARLIARGEFTAEEVESTPYLHILHDGPILACSGSFPATPEITGPWKLIAGDSLAVFDSKIFRLVSEDELVGILDDRTCANPAEAVQQFGASREIYEYPAVVVNVLSSQPGESPSLSLQ